MNRSHNRTFAPSIALTLFVMGLALPARSAGPTAEPTNAPPSKKASRAEETFEDTSASTKSDAPRNQASDGVKSGPAILVLPLQSIYRSVEQSKIQAANDLFLKELGHRDNLVVIRGGVAREGAAETSATGAKAATLEAEQAEQAREIERAVKARQRAVEELEKNAAASDADQYILARHHLARALMWAGDDKAFEEALDVVARMRPSFTLEPTQFSRLYRRTFTKAAERAMAEKPGELLVKSVLPGANITLDGRPMEVAPVRLTRVIPGKHLLGAKVPGVPAFATVLDVKSQTKNEYTVAFANTLGGSAVGVVAEAIAENTLSRKAVESAAEAGKEAGAAYVVLGGLARGEDRFHVHPFVVSVAKGALVSLDVVDFDLELLTAESDVLRIAEGVSTAVNGFKGEELAVQVIEKRIRAQATVNEVAAAAADAPESSSIKPRDSASSAKQKRDVYKPLKGSKVTIKDEEED